MAADATLFLSTRQITHTSCRHSALETGYFVQSEMPHLGLTGFLKTREQIIDLGLLLGRQAGATICHHFQLNGEFYRQMARPLHCSIL